MSQNLSLTMFSNTVPLKTYCSLLSDVLRLAEKCSNVGRYHFRVNIFQEMYATFPFLFDIFKDKAVTRVLVPMFPSIFHIFLKCYFRYVSSEYNINVLSNPK